MNVLYKHAPVKEKLIRGNNGLFMNKTISKAYMHRVSIIKILQWKTIFNTKMKEITS